MHDWLSNQSWTSCTYYKCKTSREKRAVKEAEKKLAWERFHSIDSNKNLVIEFDEAVNYLVRSDSKYGNRTETGWFDSIDSNKNGVIESYEFDEIL